jgi:hypothetical protein
MDLNVKTSNGKEYILPIDQNEMLVRKTIHRNDNPHPVLLIGIIIIIIILVYYIYINGIKKNITGDWYVGDNSTYVTHDICTDNIYVEGYPVGHVKGNAVFIENVVPNGLPFMGTLYNKKIYWTNGAVWTQVQYV